MDPSWDTWDWRERKWTMLGSDLDGVLFGDISGVAKNWRTLGCADPCEIQHNVTMCIYRYTMIYIVYAV